MDDIGKMRKTLIFLCAMVRIPIIQHKGRCVLGLLALEIYLMIILLFLLYFLRINRRYSSDS